MKTATGTRFETTSASAPNERLTTWVAFVRAHAVVTGAVERDLEDAGQIPLTWYEVLVRLSRAPDNALRMQELATSLYLSKSGATRLVDRMEAAGLVARISCASDRRGTFATLTAAGRKAARRAAPIVARSVERRFTGLLTLSDRARVRQVWDKVASQQGLAGSS